MYPAYQSGFVSPDSSLWQSPVSVAGVGGKRHWGWWRSSRHFVLAVQVPGHVDDDDVAVAAHEKEDLEQVGALVVQEILPPVTDDQLRHEDEDAAALIFNAQLDDVVDQRLQDVAIGRPVGDEDGARLVFLAQGLDRKSVV